jgi:hypothetical protein
MPCEPYQHVLTDAAARGAEPQGELRAHLDSCTACRSAFAQERSLFSAIDAGLHFTANASIPASFLQRVLARLAQETTVRYRWASPSFVLASAAAVVLAFLLVHNLRRSAISQKPPDAALNQISPMRISAPPLSQDSVPLRSARNDSGLRQQHDHLRTSAPSEISVSNQSIPEVLVPRDQEVLLALYVEQSRRRTQAVLVVDSRDETTLAPLQVSPIQIAQLDVKLLAEAQSQ